MRDDERDVLDLWQNQPAEGFRMTKEEIQLRLEELNGTLRWRTRAGYLVCAFLIVAFFAWTFVEEDLMMRAGAAATIAAVAYLGYQVHQNRYRGGAAPAMATASIDHLRAELARQRDFHRGSRFWSRMLFLGAAGLLFFLGFMRAHPEVAQMIRFELAAFIVFTIAALPLNMWMAKRYQRQIDELDRQKEHA